MPIMSFANAAAFDYIDFALFTALMSAICPMRLFVESVNDMI